MPLVIGGQGLNTGPLIDQQRYTEEALRRAAMEAQQRNDAQAQNSVRLADGRDAARSQMDALARQADAQMYARQQDVLQNHRADQNFTRQGDWHAEDLVRHAAQDQWLKDRHAEDLQFKAKKEAQDVVEFGLRQKALADHDQRQHEFNTEHELGRQRDKVFHDLPGLDFDTAQGIAKRWSGQQDAPPFDPADFENVPVNVPDAPGTMSAPAPVDDALRELAKIHNGSLDLRRETEQRVAGNRERSLGLRERGLDLQEGNIDSLKEQRAATAKRQQDRDKFEADTLALKREVMPLLGKADPALAYEFAKATGDFLPPGNAVQDAEMKEIWIPAAANDKDMMGNPRSTPEMKRKAFYESQMSTKRVKAIAEAIKREASPVTPAAPGAAPVNGPTPTKTPYLDPATAAANKAFLEKKAAQQYTPDQLNTVRAAIQAARDAGEHDEAILKRIGLRAIGQDQEE